MAASLTAVVSLQLSPFSYRVPCSCNSSMWRIKGMSSMKPKRKKSEAGRDARFMLRIAVAYAQRGWAVHVLRDDKRPIFKEWGTAASTDAVLVEDWWSAYPHAPIGIVTG